MYFLRRTWILLCLAFLADWQVHEAGWSVMCVLRALCMASYLFSPLCAPSPSSVPAEWKAKALFEYTTVVFFFITKFPIHFFIFFSCVRTYPAVNNSFSWKQKKKDVYVFVVFDFFSSENLPPSEKVAFKMRRFFGLCLWVHQTPTYLYFFSPIRQKVNKGPRILQR